VDSLNEGVAGTWKIYRLRELPCIQPHRPGAQQSPPSPPPWPTAPPPPPGGGTNKPFEKITATYAGEILELKTPSHDGGTCVVHFASE